MKPTYLDTHRQNSCRALELENSAKQLENVVNPVQSVLILAPARPFGFLMSLAVRAL